MTPHLSTAKKPPARFTYSLGELMLLVTLISLHLGLIAAAPCLGVPVALLAVPSYAWSSLMVAKKRAEGSKVGLADALELFVESFVWVVLALLIAAFLGAIVFYLLVGLIVLVVQEPSFARIPGVFLAVIFAVLVTNRILKRQRANVLPRSMRPHKVTHHDS